MVAFGVFPGGASAQAVDPASKNAPTTTQPNIIDRQMQARLLADRGQHEAALKEYLWCFDEGPTIDPTYARIRNGVLIREILDLAKSYAPARDAMHERRAAALKRLTDGDGTEADAATLVSIDRQFGDMQRSVRVYDDLMRTSPNRSLLISMSRLLFEPLLKQRRYRDIEFAYDDLPTVAMRQFEYYRHAGDMRPQLLSGVTTPQAFEATRLLELRQGVGDYYEVLVAIDRPDEAKTLAEKLLEVDESAETYLELASRALRSGRPGPADVTLARKADELYGERNASALAVLAELMAMTGQVDPAVTLLQQRIPRFAKDSERAYLNITLQRMAKYAKPPR